MKERRERDAVGAEANKCVGELRGQCARGKTGLHKPGGALSVSNPINLPKLRALGAIDEK